MKLLFSSSLVRSRGASLLKTEKRICSERGMQDVFLSYKNSCASRQGLFIGDEKFDSHEMS